MAQQTFREMGMDTMERLYYERKDARQRAYTAKQRKQRKNEDISRKMQKQHNSGNFVKSLKQALCNYNMY